MGFLIDLNYLNDLLLLLSDFFLFYRNLYYYFESISSTFFSYDCSKAFMLVYNINSHTDIRLLKKNLYGVIIV